MREISGAPEGNKAQMSSAENYSEIWESNQTLLLNGWQWGNFSKMRHSAGCNKTNDLIHATQHIISRISRAEALEKQKKKHLSEWTTCFAEATSWSQIRISSPRRLRDRTTSQDITSANTHKGRTQTPASRKSSFWEHKPDQWRANCMLSSKWTTYLRYSCNVANIASLALLSHISVSLK